MDVGPAPNTRQRRNAESNEEGKNETLKKEVFGSPSFKVPRSKRGREDPFSPSRRAKRQMGGDSALAALQASPSSVSPATRALQMGLAATGSRTRRQSVVRSLGLSDPPLDTPPSVTNEEETAVTQSAPSSEQDKESLSFSLEFKAPCSRTSEKETAVTHSTSSLEQNDESSSFSLEFKVSPPVDVSSPVPMKPASHIKKPRSSPPLSLASSLTSSPLSMKPIGASTYSLSGWEEGRRNNSLREKSSQHDGVRRSSRRSLSLSGGVGESGRFEESSEKKKGGSVTSSPLKTLEVKRNLSEMFLKEGAVDNRVQVKETFAERSWEMEEEANEGFGNTGNDDFRKDSFLRHGEDSDVFPLDGDVLLRSPSSLDLDRTREFERDPVFRGMQFMGCEHQYTDAHYARFLQQEEKKMAEKTRP